MARSELMFLRRKIEWVRQSMMRLAAAKGSLVDREVIEASQKLDRLIVEYQRLKLYLESKRAV